jgi:hypothetical protein
MNFNRQIIVTAIPIILVNLAAVFAQYAFISSHLPTWGIAGDLLLALAIESIAIQLSYFAHLAMVSGDSYAKLRISAIGFAVLVGFANGSHYLSDGRITFAAIAVALCSISSPILWGVYSRRVSRDRLLAQGLVEGHSVRLGSARWFYWPIRTLHVFRISTWSGETRPDIAIQNWEQEETERKAQAQRDEPATESETKTVTLATARTKADAIRAALAELGETLAASAVAEWLAERGWTVTPSHVRVIRSQVRNNGNAQILELAKPPRELPAASDQ